MVALKRMLNFFDDPSASAFGFNAGEQIADTDSRG
jgi:hypothetical protein